MIKLSIIVGVILILVSLGAQYLPEDTQEEISDVVKKTSKEVKHHVKNGYSIVKENIVDQK